MVRELEDRSKAGAIFTHASDSTKKHIGKYQVSGLHVGDDIFLLQNVPFDARKLIVQCPYLGVIAGRQLGNPRKRALQRRLSGSTQPLIFVEKHHNMGYH